MNTELIRIVDAISRDKSIDKESIYLDLEAAMASAVRKKHGDLEDVVVTIDRTTGQFAATVEGESIDVRELGRIAAQTAKQVMIQKIREDERSSIFEEFSTKVGTVITGSVSRFEGGSLIVTMGRGEGILPRSEQLPGESHHPGDRIRAMILDVRESQTQVKIVLTRTHVDFIRRLFELEVPEVGERIIELRALAREAGYRTKIAVSSIDTKVDAVGACVGVRGSRIRNIVDELNGEKIDIVRWNESSQILISNALKPAEIKEVFLCFELGRATVLVADDQLSLAIGKRGQNVRLAARLTGWDIDILTPVEYDKCIDALESVLKQVDGVDDIMLDKMLAMGMISLADVDAVGTEPLVQELEVSEDLATSIVEAATKAAREIAEREAAEKERAAEAAAVAAAAGESVASSGEPEAPTGEAGLPLFTETDTAEADLAVGTAPDTAGSSPFEDPKPEPLNDDRTDARRGAGEVESDVTPDDGAPTAPVQEPSDED